MKHRMIVGLCAIAGCSVMTAKPDAGAARPYHVDRTLAVGGEGRWDYITFDPASQLLYVPRSSHTQIIQPASGEVVADIPGTQGVHGVAIATEAGRGFTSDGKSNSVTIFDLKTHKKVGSTTVGEKPDAIVYDASSKSVFVFNAGSDSATVIDPAAAPGAPVKATIALGGGPESCVSDNAGHVYVNLEEENEIVAIDTKTMKVDATWKLAGGEGPTGLAIDFDRHRLFVGCHNNLMAVVDSTSGKTLATVPIGQGNDACAFDPETREAFASCSDGTVTVVKETAGGKFEGTQTIRTKPGARTLTLDPATHTLYLPTAEFGETPAGERWPSVKPGTFVILVVNRS